MYSTAPEELELRWHWDTKPTPSEGVARILELVREQPERGYRRRSEQVHCRHLDLESTAIRELSAQRGSDGVSTPPDGVVELPGTDSQRRSMRRRGGNGTGNRTGTT